MTLEWFCQVNESDIGDIEMIFFSESMLDDGGNIAPGSEATY
jgi:hypothetical protein